MKKNSQEKTLHDDDINLHDVIHDLLSSGKFIILFTILITLFASFYVKQKDDVYVSNALIEIGHSYKASQSSKELNLVEPLKGLINNLNVMFIYKTTESLGDNLAFNQIESEILSITISSNEMDKAKASVEKIAKYVFNRHQNIFAAKKSIEEANLINQIDQIERAIAFNKERALSSYNEKVTLLNFKLIQLNHEFSSLNKRRVSQILLDLPYIKKRIIELKTIINEDQLNLELLQNNPTLLVERAINSPTLNQIIYQYKADLLNLESQKEALQTELNGITSLAEETQAVLDFNQQKESLNLELQLLSSLQEARNSDFYSGKNFSLSTEKLTLERKLSALKNRIFIDSSLIKINENKIPKKQVFWGIFAFIIGFFISIALVLFFRFIGIIFKNYSSS